MNNGRMLIKDFMTKELPVLKKGDTVSYVLQLMDEFKVRHLPMVDNGMFECLIDEKSLLSRTNVNEVIGSTVIPFASSWRRWAMSCSAQAAFTTR